MLNPACQDFRAGFEPRAELAADLAAHRCACAACGTWADRLEDFTAGEAPAPLPGGLRERLLAIPGDQAARPVGCGDVERLYETTWSKAWEGEADPAVDEHFAACGRCRALYGALEAAFRTPRRRMPQALSRRLRSVVQRPRVPLFARDGRLAVAASAVLTASLLLFVSDPVSVLDTTTTTVSSRATELAEVGEERGQALWETLTDELETRYERGRALLAEQGGAYRELWQEARSHGKEKWRQLFASVTLKGKGEGENDGEH